VHKKKSYFLVHKDILHFNGIFFLLEQETRLTFLDVVCRNCGLYVLNYLKDKKLVISVKLSVSDLKSHRKAISAIATPIQHNNLHRDFASTDGHNN